jgi:peptide/nickel transport system permease protein
MYIKALFQHRIFMTGFVIILMFLSVSFYYSFVLKDQLPPAYQMSYSEKGTLMDSAPFPPSLEFPLGTDKIGNSLFYLIIDGAKYTIILSVVVGFIRLGLGLFFGFVLVVLPENIKIVIRGFIDGLHYFPLSLYTYMLAVPIMVFSWSFGEGSAFYGPLIIISLLSTPILAMYLSNEIQRIYHKEFIRNAKIMGGSWWHIFITHVRPYFLPHLFIVLIQQIGQVIVLFAHLGVLGMFIGGGIHREVGSDERTGERFIEIFSASNEWGGLIAKYFHEFLTHPILVFAPVACLSIVVLSLNFIVEGLKNVYVDENIKVFTNLSNKKKQGESVITQKNPFALITPGRVRDQ